MSKGIWIAVYEKIENMETLKKYAVKATSAINKYSGKYTILKEVKTGSNMHPTYWKSFILFKKN